jgi:hypothetical protein
MNWEAIGAVGEIAGSCVVLVSLIYIAIQLRDTKKATTRTARLERNSALSRTVLETPELAEILSKINKVDGSSQFVGEMQLTYNLSPAEAELYLRYLATAWRTLETDFLTLDDDTQIKAPIIGQLQTPSSSRFIEIRGNKFNPDFVKLVDRLKNDMSK